MQQYRQMLALQASEKEAGNPKWLILWGSLYINMANFATVRSNLESKANF